MSQRINVMISDDNWRHLSAVTKGERSRVINEALAEQRRLQLRKRAAQEMDALSITLPPYEGAAEEWVRADRDSHT